MRTRVMRVKDEAAAKAGREKAKVTKAATQAYEANRRKHRKIITVSDSPVNRTGLPASTGKINDAALHGVANGRVARLRGVFGDPGGFVMTQAPAPVTLIDPASKSGAGVTNFVAPHSPTPPFTRLPSGPREYRPIAARPARKVAVALSAHTIVDPSGDEDEMEDQRVNGWRSREYQANAYIAEMNEVPEGIDYPFPVMQCWNCCRCLRLRPSDDGTRKWRYYAEKDVDGTLKCRTCGHHCCADCAIGGLEEKEHQQGILTGRHSGWAAEPGQLAQDMAIRETSIH